MWNPLVRWVREWVEKGKGREGEGLRVVKEVVFD